MKQAVILEQQYLIALRLAYQELLQSSSPIIRQALDHQSPAYRHAAVVVIGKKKLHNYRDSVIELLADEDIRVQQIARRCLVELAKDYSSAKQDFGPLPGGDFQKSISLWTDWWSNYPQPK